MSVYVGHGCALSPQSDSAFSLCQVDYFLCFDKLTPEIVREQNITEARASRAHRTRSPQPSEHKAQSAQGFSFNVLYIYMYIYIYIYMYVCMYVCMYVFMYIHHICIYVSIVHILCTHDKHNACMCVYIYILLIHPSIDQSIHASTHPCINACMHACMHIYIYI